MRQECLIQSFYEVWKEFFSSPQFQSLNVDFFKD